MYFYNKCEFQWFISKCCPHYDMFQIKGYAFFTALVGFWMVFRNQT